jgi:hypothetical protein
MGTWHVRVSVMALGLMIPVAASAQGSATTPSTATRELSEKIITHEQVLPILRDGAGASAQGSVEPKFLLLGSTDGGVTAKARIGWIPRNNVLFDTVVSGPISEGEAQLLSVQGLGNNVSVKFRGQLTWKRTDASAADNVSVRLRSGGAGECSKGNADDLDKAICLAADRAAESLVNERATSTTRSVADIATARTDLRAAILNQGTPQATPATDLRTRTNTESPSAPELKRAFAREWRRLLRDGVVKTETSFVASGSFETANQKFSFADSTTLATQQENRTGSSTELGIGLARARGTEPLFYVGAGYQFGTTYEGQRKSTICQSFVASSLKCQDIAVGGPTESDVNQLALDGRIWLLRSKLALNARYLRDLTADTNTVEFPVYFLRQVKDIDDEPAANTVPALTGGVTAGWRSGQQREFYVYFFVGTVLGIPGLP